jgi:hypothetical protein
MENDEIKYYEYIGSQEKADGYGCDKPIRNKVYSENKEIGGDTVNYWAVESPVDEFNLEWKLVDKPNTK